jgi:ABC-type lipoprotein release transport system permease subunit
MAIAMKPGITFALAGVVIGIVLALAAVRLLQHMLWGVRPVDVETFAFTGIGLLAVAAVATLLPALRLRNLDPAQTLRDE